MPDKVRPALTPEEWGYRSKERSDAIEEISVEIDGGRFCLREWNGNDLQGTTHTNVVKLPPELLPAAMALANAALPDDDPRKITRDLWYALDQVVRGQWPTEKMRENALRVVGILAALLPPE